MCAYSMIVDHFHDKWQRKIPPAYQEPCSPPLPNPYPRPIPGAWPMPKPLQPYPTKEELEDLVELLKKAKEYDTSTGQKECELEEKKERLRKLAKTLGVEIEFP